MPPLDRSIYDFAIPISNTRLFEQQSSRERTVIGFIITFYYEACVYNEYTYTV